MSFFGALTLIFIVLKLVDVIAWSWWLVLLPMWGPLLILIALALIVGALK
jgi:hypothetical protein